MTQKHHTNSSDSIIFFAVFVIKKLICQINSPFLRDRACSKLNNWSNGHLNSISISDLSWGVQILFQKCDLWNLKLCFMREIIWNFCLYISSSLNLEKLFSKFAFIFFNVSFGCFVSFKFDVFFIVFNWACLMSEINCCFLMCPAVCYVLFDISYLTSYFRMQVCHI